MYIYIYIHTYIALFARRNPFMQNMEMTRMRHRK